MMNEPDQFAKVEGTVWAIFEYIVGAGASLIPLWLFWVAFKHGGIIEDLVWVGIFVLLLSVRPHFIFPSLVFMAATSGLCFFYHAAGNWLAITSYVLCGIYYLFNFLVLTRLADTIPDDAHKIHYPEGYDPKADRDIWERVFNSSAKK